VDETLHMVKCFLCETPFQFGPRIYNGRRIPEWDMMVCRAAATKATGTGSSLRRGRICSPISNPKK
jgi:hypothetical protein